MESAVLRQIGVNVRETEGVSWFEFPWKSTLRQGFKCKFLVCKLMLRSISRGWRSELQKEGSQSGRSMSILLRVKAVRNHVRKRWHRACFRDVPYQREGSYSINQYQSTVVVKGWPPNFLALLAKCDPIGQRKSTNRVPLLSEKGWGVGNSES